MFFREEFVPWNKGKAVGQKKPLTITQASAIKAHLEQQSKLRDLALFSTAFDTLLRGIDVVSLRVEDVQRRDGSIREEFCVRQQKTGYGTSVGLTPYTQTVLRRWIRSARLTPSSYLFVRERKGKDKPISTDQYRKLVKTWVRAINLDPSEYSTHSLRRSKAVMVYKATKQLDAVMSLLGHQDISSTKSYLDTDHHDALAVARSFQLSG